VTTIILARHGESEWNRAGRWQGHADPPLTDRGREQAAELAVALTDVALEAIYASDLRRAADTAEIVASALGLPVTTDPLLREVDVGEWSGLTAAEVEQRYPAAFRRYRAGGDGWEQGEPHATMTERVTAAVAGIAALYPSGQVLCVLHGGVIGALLAQAEGVTWSDFRRANRGLTNGTVARIAVENRTFRRID